MPQPTLRSTDQNPSRRWPAALLRLGLALAVWALLTGAAPDSWLIGVPAALLATAASLYWSGTTPYSLRPLATLRFLGFFVRRSLAGGIDVARRAISRGPQVDPALLTLPLQLPPGPPRWLLVSTVSLLPGSFAVQASATTLTVHTIDQSMAVAAEVAEVQRRVAALFGIALATPT